MVCFSIVTSADFNMVPSLADVSQIRKQRCLGYTIIEAGKGVDCYGDTIMLVKQHGFYEVASRNKPVKNPGLILN